MKPHLRYAPHVRTKIISPHFLVPHATIYPSFGLGFGAGASFSVQVATFGVEEPIRNLL